MMMSLALLHTGARLGVTSFTVHPSTVIGILGLAGLYQFGARRVTSPAALDAKAPRGSASRIPTRGQRTSYYLALVVMFLSLNGWLHDLSDSYLFSAHMLQHLLLAFVVAPLMVMGTPGGMLRPVLALRGVGPVGR